MLKVTPLDKRKNITCLLSLQSRVLPEADVLRCWCSRVWSSAASECNSSSNPKVNFLLTFLHIFYQVLSFSCASDALIYIHNSVNFNLWYYPLKHIIAYSGYEVSKLPLNLIVQSAKFVSSPNFYSSYLNLFLSAYQNLNRFFWYYFTVWFE